ncbi:hypothetical protein ACG2LH_12610 [Zhouia sp. PK063]|uniref:hypothetical protein n=1 Tax=Zhouia sp. PK063 TaxID=3373602 RepID=UPI0037ABF1F9
MKTNYLFPNRYKKLGWLLFIPGVIFALLYIIYEGNITFFDMHVLAIAYDDLAYKIISNNVLDELASILIIIGALLIAFSKEKLEDEFISKIRLESLVWATYLNYAILLFTVIFVYSFTFLWVLMFNMFTLLIFFLIRFNWALNTSKKQMSNEE